MSMVRDYLRKVAADIGTTPSGKFKYLTFQQFVWDHGREYTPAPLPPNWRRGKMGDCFRNAYCLAEADRSLRYVEGFATCIAGKYTVGLLGLHAWCATADGKALDPTWKDGVEYFGVPFDWSYVLKTVSKLGRFGVIDNWENQFPLLRGDDHDWQLKNVAA